MLPFNQREEFSFYKNFLRKEMEVIQKNALNLRYISTIRDDEDLKNIKIPQQDDCKNCYPYFFAKYPSYHKRNLTDCIFATSILISKEKKKGASYDLYS